MISSFFPHTDSALIQWIFWMVNVITFFVYAWDKRKAIYHQSRIPEVVLLLLAFIGGSVGAMCAMFFFRHKIKNPKFYITVPILLIIQLAIYGYLCWVGIL